MKIKIPAGCLKVLASEGITATTDATIKQIADQNGLTTQDVFTAIGKAAAEK